MICLLATTPNFGYQSLKVTRWWLHTLKAWRMIVVRSIKTKAKIVAMELDQMLKKMRMKVNEHQIDATSHH